jgi:pilus assembly protein CpaD
MTRANPHLSKVAAAGLVLTLLSACASSGAPPEAALAPRTDTDKWADRVQVDSHPDEVLLVLHPEGLSPAQNQALDGLLGRWLAAEGREIVVSAPLGGANADTAGRMAVAARQRLVAMGAPPASVRVVGYDAAAAPAAPLKVGFMRFEAKIPRCGGWENLSATRDNDAYGNFGCAVSANVAAQVANPEDLLGPRGSTPIDAARRDTVLDKYRKGETTASAKEDQATGAISKAVN